MDDGFVVRWWQEVDEEGTVDEDGGYFTSSKKKYQKKNGMGILRRMRDRQVERERRGRKTPFNKYEGKMINTLYQHQTPLTTGKVAKYAGHSCNTTKKYLRRLAEKRYVKFTHYGNAVYWWLREVDEDK